MIEIIKEENLYQQRYCGCVYSLRDTKPVGGCKMSVCELELMWSFTEKIRFQMIITLVAAMDGSRLIGRNNALPWHLPADLAHFKVVTLGKPIVMGRRTFESLGRPLLYRRNVVITQQDNLVLEGCDVFRSLDDALGALAQEREIMIIGGARIFGEALSKANKMILTIIDHTFKGDAYFPEWNAGEWRIVSEEIHPSDGENLYAFRFLELERLDNRLFLEVGASHSQ